jgi:predicted RNA-binding Zn-ribbon protein involved in translation (DUF1610 family)/uncharacterized protein (DUF433 family)
MSKPVINAQEALDLIRAGKSDSELMARFNLSAKGLQSLFIKLVRAGALDQAELDRRFPDRLESVTISAESEAQTGQAPLQQPPQKPTPAPGPSIKAGEALKDIRLGMSDSDLMDKYRLSAKGLQNLFDQLVKAGAIGQSELDRRFSSKEETVDLLGIIRKLGLDYTAVKSEEKKPIPSRCVACGAPQTFEFEECPMCGVNIKEYKEKKVRENRAASAVWKCPACGRPQEKEYDECPVCGVIVSRFKKPTQ